MGVPNRGLFTSITDEWPTPQKLFDALDHEFRFTVDVCASAANAKCAHYFTREQDGLAQPWGGVAFMNPPFGRGLASWAAKAHEEAVAGATVVCLIPCRTDTAWWHDHIMSAAELRFIRGRLSFDGEIQRKRHEATGAHNAPFPSVVAVFKPGPAPFPSAVAVFRPGLPTGRPPVISAIDRQGVPL